MKVNFKVYDVVINNEVKQVAFPGTARAKVIEGMLKTAGAKLWRKTAKIKLDVSIPEAICIELPIIDGGAVVMCAVHEVIEECEKRLTCDTETTGHEREE